MNRSIVSAIALCLLAGCGGAQTPPPAPASENPREKNRAAVAQAFKDNQARAAGNPDLWVRMGVVADRKARRVAIQAEAMGLEKGGNPPEFFLIAERSAHDYEALAVSFAKPSDVHEALVFIGLHPGRPVNGAALQFWPKGERVVVTFACNDPRKPFGPVRAESLFMDNRTGAILPATGLVFTGSRPASTPGGKADEKVYGADVEDPHSIAANYNEAHSVLDIPRQCPKGAAYDHLAVNPEYVLPMHAMVTVCMEPERRDGTNRVVDVALTVKPGAGKALAFDLTLAGGGPRVANGSLNDVLREFTGLTGKGRDPFVTVAFDDALELRTVRDTCALLASIETENGIRIEPPPAGQLYYKSFVPPEKFRDRANRLAQPWELHFSRKGEALVVRLTQVVEVWKTDDLRPELKISHADVPTPEALCQELTARGPGLPVILVFAPPTVTHGEVLRFVGPVLKTHGTVHVYLQEATPPAAPAPAG